MNWPGLARLHESCITELELPKSIIGRAKLCCMPRLVPRPSVLQRACSVRPVMLPSRTKPQDRHLRSPRDASELGGQPFHTGRYGAYLGLARYAILPARCRSLGIALRVSGRSDAPAYAHLEVDPPLIIGGARSRDNNCKTSRRSSGHSRPDDLM
ncbi:hypothetical protein BC834DRAFT_562144 [Gloeopeniophorella convolvens]|nr:hypothetical protein BC834DRAFT_562144 [Gloeopeniophorella convolvens]